MEQGTYKATIAENEINFYNELGFPRSVLEPMKNATWWITIRKAGNDRWVVTETIDEMPSYAMTVTYQDGKPSVIENHPLVGGRAEVTLKRIGENEFEGKMKTDKYGEMSWTESYDEDGFVFRTKSDKTKTKFEGKAERVIKLPGWYRFVKGENVENFLKALGYPEDTLDGPLDLVERVDVQDDTYTVTEYFNGDKNVFKYRLDEECDFRYTGIKDFDRKTLTTKIGNGKFKAINRGKKGEKEEWTMQFSDEGLHYTGVDLKSGQICKMWFERFVQTNGKFKVIATSGYEKMGKLMGLDSDFVSKISNDFDAVLTISERDDIVTYVFDSKHMPSAASFKWDEEFEKSHPKIPGTFKCIETKSGDTVTAISMNKDYQTIRSTFKFTENFAIQTSEIVGTGVETKVVYERIE